MMHVVTIDLQTAKLKLLVTPKTPNNSQTTSVFLKKFKMKLAINASYFAPFHEHTPWDYYPRTGDPTAPIGEAISNGDRYGVPLKEWPVLCILQGNIAKIIDSGSCPKDTINGVAGRELLVSNGKPTDKRLLAQDDKPYPRVAVGTDRNGTKLWLIIIDGKQPLYSEGVTKVELSQIFTKLGVDKAINLDGGGSTTLVVDTGNGATVLNAPIHAKLPTNERPVANHIGFYVP
ncbi:phosphodiester glycosidase family protein [Chamaesiphon sp. VAR_48_metabat_403]|uniref:phosphodiester glycosidase family protein n=1 Tax=Chamaesiphon sp. VAR_48_metabat_403 TaxID=2964700 RepID=UPI00286D7D75|nr:phosphodiester glycosidase family protein [Chamaesiphon sp. VAR_48_metabat_403]